LKFFIDSTILFDSIVNDMNGRKLKRKLHHIKNDNHILTTSLTVFGEIILVCLRDKRIDDLHDIIDLIVSLDIQSWTPNLVLRNCCKCLDKVDKHNRVGSSDRTHLDYAIAYEDEYFITDDSDLQKFPLDKCNCRKCKRSKKPKTNIISSNQITSILNSNQ